MIAQLQPKHLIKNISIMKIYPTSILLSLFALAAFLLPVDTQAQIHEIDQTIYGMDCAPCAYSVENRMKRMDGARNVTLSLNRGNTTAEFTPESGVTLKEIRDAIRKGGFDAREATLRLTGTLNREGETWTVILPTGEKFQLDQYEHVISVNELEQHTGREITLTGHVEKGYSPPEKGWVLKVNESDAQRT
jgi:copper chaperone CopZ